MTEQNYFIHPSYKAKEKTPPVEKPEKSLVLTIRDGILHVKAVQAANIELDVKGQIEEIVFGLGH